MSKTKHLDTAIEIFRGGVAKRPARKAQAEIVGTPHGNRYTVTVNGKIVEEGDVPLGRDIEMFITDRVVAKAEALRALGKTTTMTVHAL